MVQRNPITRLVNGRHIRTFDAPSFTGVEQQPGVSTTRVGYGGSLPIGDEYNRDLNWIQRNGTARQISYWQRIFNSQPRAAAGMNLLWERFQGANISVADNAYKEDDPRHEMAAMQQAFWVWQINELGKVWPGFTTDLYYALLLERAAFTFEFELRDWLYTPEDSDKPQQLKKVWAWKSIKYFPTRVLHSPICDCETNEIVGWNYYPASEFGSSTPVTGLAPYIWAARHRPEGAMGIGQSVLRPGYSAYQDWMSARGARFREQDSGSGIHLELSQDEDNPKTRASEIFNTVDRMEADKLGAIVTKAGETMDRYFPDGQYMKTIEDTIKSVAREFDNATGAGELGVGEDGRGALTEGQNRKDSGQSLADAYMRAFICQVEVGPVHWLHRRNFGTLIPPPGFKVEGILPRRSHDPAQTTQILGIKASAKADGYSREETRDLIQAAAPHMDPHELDRQVARFPTLADQEAQANMSLSSGLGLVQGQSFARRAEGSDDTGNPSPAMTLSGRRELSSMELACGVNPSTYALARDNDFQGGEMLVREIGQMVTEAFFDAHGDVIREGGSDLDDLLNGSALDKLIDAQMPRLDNYLQSVEAAGREEQAVELAAVGHDVGGLSLAIVDGVDTTKEAARLREQVRRDIREQVRQAAENEARNVASGAAPVSPAGVAAIVAGSIWNRVKTAVQSGVKFLRNVGRKAAVAEVPGAEFGQRSNALEGRPNPRVSSDVCDPCDDTDLMTFELNSAQHRSIGLFGQNPNCQSLRSGRQFCACVDLIYGPGEQPPL